MLTSHGLLVDRYSQGEDSTFMNSTKQLVLTALTLAIFSAGARAQTSYPQATQGESAQSPGSVASANAQPADTDLRSEVEQLKQLVREQQKRIDALETGRQSSASVNSTPANSTSFSATPSSGESQL